MTTILGGRTSDHCILRDAFLAAGSELVVTTEDGSAGRRGLVTDALAEIAKAGADGRLAQTRVLDAGEPSEQTPSSRPHRTI